VINEIAEAITAVGVFTVTAVVIGVAWLTGVLFTMVLERIFDWLSEDKPYDEEDD